MGHSCELRFDDISILAQKSDVPDDLICLFQESDRRQSGGGPGDEDYSLAYVAGRDIVLQRLDLLGHSSERSQRHFEEWLEQERQTWNEYEQSEKGGWASETAIALHNLSYLEWRARARNVLLTRYDRSRPTESYTDETDRRMRDLSDDWLFYSAELVPVLRSFLDALPDVREVSLDVADLVIGGYLDPDERICELRRAMGFRWRSGLEPTVIMAEGSTDIAILKRSLEKLYPYLKEYFAFFDYEGPRVDAGASFLLKFLKAFAGARINTDIIAIFDNDATGADAYIAASRLPLPNNIRVTKLPDIELAGSYPTVGPQGEHDIDINGKGVSIELFLGEHNLSANDGKRLPIIWTSYVPTVGRYQGAIDGKRRIFERFMAETLSQETSDYFQRRFPELVVLWEHVFARLRG